MPNLREKGDDVNANELVIKSVVALKYVFYGLLIGSAGSALRKLMEEQDREEKT